MENQSVIVLLKTASLHTNIMEAKLKLYRYPERPYCLILARSAF